MVEDNNPFDDKSDIEELFDLIEEAIEKSEVDKEKVHIGRMGSGKGNSPFGGDSPFNKRDPFKEKRNPNKSKEPLIDKVEYEDEIAVIFDLSGYNKEDVEIEVENGDLIVNAFKQTSSIGRENYKKVVELENNVEDINTEFNNGVLRVIVPKE